MVILLCLDTGYRSLPLQHSIIIGHGVTFFENVYYYCLAQGFNHLPDHNGVDPEVGGWEVTDAEITYHSGGLDTYMFKLINPTNVIEVGP